MQEDYNENNHKIAQKEKPMAHKGNKPYTSKSGKRVVPKKKVKKGKSRRHGK